MISVSELEAMSNQDIEKLDPQNLMPLSGVRLKSDASQAEKILSFMEQIGNPYCYLCGNTPVKVCFTEDGKDINQALMNIFRSIP